MKIEYEKTQNTIINTKRHRLDKIKTDKVRGPNSKPVTNGPEAQNENEHNSPDKIGRLH